MSVNLYESIIGAKLRRNRKKMYYPAAIVNLKKNWMKMKTFFFRSEKAKQEIGGKKL
jgi:hypothetical protein